VKTLRYAPSMPNSRETPQILLRTARHQSFCHHQPWDITSTRSQTSGCYICIATTKSIILQFSQVVAGLHLTCTYTRWSLPAIDDDDDARLGILGQPAERHVPGVYSCDKRQRNEGRSTWQCPNAKDRTKHNFRNIKYKPYIPPSASPGLDRPHATEPASGLVLLFVPLVRTRVAVRKLLLPSEGWPSQTGARRRRPPPAQLLQQPQGRSQNGRSEAAKGSIPENIKYII
jgi:hypothetical protein